MSVHEIHETRRQTAALNILAGKRALNDARIALLRAAIIMHGTDISDALRVLADTAAGAYAQIDTTEAA